MITAPTSPQTPQSPIVLAAATAASAIGGSATPAGSSNDSTIWNFTIPAGGTFLIGQDGTSFEFTVQSGPVAVRRRTGKFSSQYNKFANGTGVRNVAFTSLEVKNLSANNPVVCQMVVGSAQFINHQLVVVQGGIGGQNVVFPTYPVANAAASVAFNDLSGTAFTDINGGKWLAVSRVAIVICNTDTGVTYLLHKAGGVTASAPSIAAIYPQTSWNEPISGDYCLNVGGAMIDVIAHEIYAAIPST